MRTFSTSLQGKDANFFRQATTRLDEVRTNIDAFQMIIPLSLWLSIHFKTNKWLPKLFDIAALGAWRGRRLLFQRYRDPGQQKQCHPNMLSEISDDKEKHPQQETTKN